MDESALLDDQRNRAPATRSCARQQVPYSNLGYTIAGAILARFGGKTWEELVTERIIEPLGTLICLGLARL